LKQYVYILNDFRRLDLGQKLLDIALDFAKSVGYSRMGLDSSKDIICSKFTISKEEFVDIPRYMITIEQIY
jgi:GNAT superfamily N-acetyltransferase